MCVEIVNELLRGGEQWQVTTSRDPSPHGVIWPLFYFRKRWLRQTGSPNSIIDRTNFTNASEIPEFTFQGFEIRRTKI